MGVHIFGNRRETIEELVKSSVAGIEFRKTIEFASGIKSPGCYLDCRVLPAHPGLWHRCINGMDLAIQRPNEDQVPFPSFDTIASVEAGAVPHGSALALVMRKPHVSVAKEAKGHGKGGFVRGDMHVVRKKRILIVEDVTTTGESAMKAVEKLSNEGADVVGILSLATYGFPELYELSHQSGIPFYVKCHFEWILDHFVSKEKINPQHEAIVRAWLKDPRAPWEWPMEPA